MMQSITETRQLFDVTGNSGFFVDGDWVESKDQNPDGEVRLTQLADIGVGEFLDRSSRFLTKDTASELNCTFIEEGDILVARMPDPIGRACIFPGNTHPCVTVVDVCIIRPDSRFVDNRWLMWIINSPEFKHQLKPFLSGTTRQRISRKNLQKLPIKIPPLEEQKRIAAILDKADAIRRSRKKAIALTEELLRSTFLDMFGDPVTNPKGWQKTTYGKLIPEKGQIVDGPFGSSLKPECYVSDGVRVVRNFNIKNDFFDKSEFVYVTEEKFTEIQRSNIKCRDLLLSTKGTIGNVCIMPELDGKSVLSASGTVRIRFSKNSQVLPEFAVQQMVQKNYKQYMKWFEAGTNQKYLNLSGIRKMELIVPPLELQQKFLNLRTKNYLLKARSSNAFVETDNLFDSLLQKAFRGEL